MGMDAAGGEDGTRAGRVYGYHTRSWAEGESLVISASPTPLEVAAGQPHWRQTGPAGWSASLRPLGSAGVAQRTRTHVGRAVLRRLIPLRASATQGAEPMDYGVQLGHRFRALKLWFVIRAFGAEG